MSLLLLLQNGKGEPEPEVVVNRLRVFERPPMRQYLLATAPSGRVERWGEDEINPANVFEDLTDSDSVPGGDKEIACGLPRKPGVDYSDMKVGSRVELFNCDGRRINEARLERTPRTSGDFLVMDPAAMGYQVRLTDKEEARAIPLDADMSAWGEPSAARKAEAGGSKINGDASAQLLPAGGTQEHPTPAAISHQWGQLVSSKLFLDVAESVYDSSGIEIGKVLLDFVDPTDTSTSTSFWSNRLYALVTGLYSQGAEPFADLEGPEKVRQEFAVAAGHFFLALFDAFEETHEGAGHWETQWRNIKIQDRSNLPLYGTWPEVGVLASDFIAYALSMWAQGIRFTTGPFGSLRASSFPIPHLTFKEPTTVQEMITAALKFELLEWSVRGTAQGPTFYLNARGEREGRMRWRARVRPAKLTDTGQQMDQVYNRAIVSFNGSDNVQHTVGPPGSGAQYIDVRCEDRDPLNPINEAGEERTKHLSLSTIASPEGAAESAQRFLEGCKLLDGSGEATLTGYVEDEHGAEWPYDAVHSGDLIDFVDSSIPGYRYIVEATRTRSTRSVNIKIDAPPDSYEALLERLAVRETAAGVSS